MKLNFAALESLPGVERVVAVTPDGLVFQEAGGGAPGGEVLAAELTSVVLAALEALKALSGQRLDRLTLATDVHEIVALNTPRLLLAAAVKIGASLRPVQLELARLASQLETQEVKA